MTEKIRGGAFKQMVAFGAACITAQKQAINDLNVFPVPDGDTGTNMSLTIQTAVTELRRGPRPSGCSAPRTTSSMGRGARIRGSCAAFAAWIRSARLTRGSRRRSVT